MEKKSLVIHIVYQENKRILFVFIRSNRGISTRSTINDERLQIVFFAQHLGLLSFEGSLACHTYSNTGYAFIIVIY